jgi:selenocysteine lyase/cysteine desulfurase
VARFLDESAGNPGRGGHRLSVAASRVIESARDEVATLLGADVEHTLLGPGATFWLSTLLSSWLEPGDRVVTSALEHNAVMRPLRHLERSREVEVEVVDGASPSGVPTPEDVCAATSRRRTRLVVLCHASNVTGSVLPIDDVVRAVAPVPVLVDGAQSAGSLAVDFARLGAAAFVCSGHKGLLGPPGTGVLLLHPDVGVEPLVRGGTGSRSEAEEMPEHLPDRLEAGTPNGPGIAGLGAGCRWLAEHGVDTVHRRVDSLRRRLEAGLAELPGTTVVGADPAVPRAGIVSFTVNGADPGVVVDRLDRVHGVMLRAGLHCAPAAHRRLGTFPAGTLRAGIGPFNDEGDVDGLVEALRATLASPEVRG